MCVDSNYFPIIFCQCISVLCLYYCCLRLNLSPPLSCLFLSERQIITFLFYKKPLTSIQLKCHSFFVVLFVVTTSFFIFSHHIFFGHCILLNTNYWCVFCLIFLLVLALWGGGWTAFVASAAHRRRRRHRRRQRDDGRHRHRRRRHRWGGRVARLRCVRRPSSSPPLLSPSAG